MNEPDLTTFAIRLAATLFFVLANGFFVLEVRHILVPRVDVEDLSATHS